MLSSFEDLCYFEMKRKTRQNIFKVNLYDRNVLWSVQFFPPYLGNKDNVYKGILQKHQ